MTHFQRPFHLRRFSAAHMEARLMPSCGVCLSVTFVDSVETNKYLQKFNFFHHRVAATRSTPNVMIILRWETPLTGASNDGTPPPLTGASNAGGVGKTRDLSQYLAPSRDVTS